MSGWSRRQEGMALPSPPVSGKEQAAGNARDGLDLSEASIMSECCETILIRVLRKRLL